jgi:integrase/recombinase XerD
MGAMTRKSIPKTNMNSSSRYSKFGQHLHYLTSQKLQKLWESVDDSKDKLILKLIFELGCRVGEFSMIQLKHINFEDCSVFFPAENTKTGDRRTSFIPKGLMNDLKDYLKRQGPMTKREEGIKKPDAYLFPGRNEKGHITTRALQKMFHKYIRKAGLDEVYAEDSKGRQLHKYTIHSLRHSHVRYYTTYKRLDLASVQQQVGHRSLRTTQIYTRLTDEDVRKSYERVRYEA